MALEDNAQLPRHGARAPSPALQQVVDESDLHDTGRSNFVAFLLGGVTIAGGLLAFLYLDGVPADRGDGLVTGSITRIQQPVSPIPPAAPAPSIQVPTPSR